MLLLRAIVLGCLIAMHVLGGMVLFRRLFPRESVWFGFIVPPLVLIAVLNFVEHAMALGSLVWMLPFTTAVSIWGLVQGWKWWRHVRLPAAVFLGSFAFTLTLRVLRPDIMTRRDGVLDLSLVASFCTGQRVPPPLILYPPLPLSHYYAFGHYGASVLTRLFALDAGTGFNLEMALVAALVCVLSAGVAWSISGRNTWVTILTALLTACGNTGASAYLALTMKDLNPNYAGIGMIDFQYQSPLWEGLKSMPWEDRPELIAPGAWNWIGDLHSNTFGLLLILLMSLSLVEILRRRRTNWPWICMGAIPFFTVVTTTWGLVLEGPILLAALYWIWRERFLPRSRRFVVFGLGGLIVLLLPAVLQFSGTTGYPGGHWESYGQRTPLDLFTALWWPVYLPWIGMLFLWARLSPALKSLVVVLPLVLLGMEVYAVGIRMDWTGKLWGFIYAMAWVAFLPRICMERGYPFRLLVAALVFSGVVSLASWSGHAFRRICATRDDILHLDGTPHLSLSPLRGPILAVISRMKGQTILSGKSARLDVESPALAAFTGNYVYVSWSEFDDLLAGGDTHGGAALREKEVNAIYDGANTNPLPFLLANNIAAVVIYPDDNIAASVVERLKAELAPDYRYNDFTDGKTPAGVFVYRPAAGR